MTRRRFRIHAAASLAGLVAAPASAQLMAEIGRAHV